MGWEPKVQKRKQRMLIDEDKNTPWTRNAKNCQ